MEIDFAYDVYPISVDDYRSYDVDSIVYNDFTGEVDSFTYQMQELIADSFLDLEGRESFKFHRLFRADETEDWSIGDVWSITPSAERIEMLEENLAFNKLIFPLKFQSSWNGNALNTLDEECFEVKSFDSTASILNQEHRLSREQHYRSVNLIERRSQEEIFARGIGPVSYQKEYIFRKTDGINFENDVDSGFARLARITDYFV